MGIRRCAARRRTRDAATVAGCVGLSFVAFAFLGAPAFAAPSTPTPATVTGTPCTSSAHACVDLTTQRAWLLQNGAVALGPVGVSSGGPGKETPEGTFKVEWKDKNHKSAEQNGTPMPYSVFFAAGGVAFHGGSLSRASAGCVHLDDKDAIAFYNDLKIGDEVQVKATPPGEAKQQDENSDSSSGPRSDADPADSSESGTSSGPTAEPASGATATGTSGSAPRSGAPSATGHPSPSKATRSSAPNGSLLGARNGPLVP